MSKKEILQRLRKEFGLPSDIEFEPEIFLLKLLELTVGQIKAMQNELKAIATDYKKLDDVTVKAEPLKFDTEQFKQLLELQQETKKAIEERRIEKVIVEKEIPPSRIKIDLIHPQEEIKKQQGWWVKALELLVKQPIDGFVQALRDIFVDLRKEENAIAVKLVDPNGDTFYRAQFTGLFGGGGGGGGSGSIDISTLAKDATLVLTNQKLDSIAGYTDQLESILTSIGGYTDGLETLLTSIGGYVDGLEALVTSVGSNTDQLEGYVDQLEGFVDGLEGLLTTITGTITSSRMAVNPIPGQAGVAAGAGDIDALTQRMTQAYDTGWLTLRVNYTSAQTNVSMITASANQKIIVKSLDAMCDHANTADVAVLVGFDDTTTPTGADAILSHPGFAPGSGLPKYYGSDGVTGATAADDLKITSEAPTGGSLSLVIIYKIVSV